MLYTLKRTASVVLLFSVLAGLLVACGGGGNSSGNGNGSNCSNVQLSYWTPFTGPDGPFMARLVASFNNAHPDIQVQVTTQADYNTKLDTAAASDTLPDVAIINEDQVATQAFRHIIRRRDHHDSDFVPELQAL